MTAATEEPIVFGCSDARLIGILHRASHAGEDAARGKPGLLIVVGGPQYRVGSHRQFVLMARELARAGYPVLRFDYRGMGDSEGEPRSFEHIGEDIRCAMDAFAAHAELDGVVLWGLCDAASACLMYAAADARVRGVIVANPWVRTEAGEAGSYIKYYYGRRLLQRTFWLKALKGELELLNSLCDFARKLMRVARDRGPAPQSFIERMHSGLAAFGGPMLTLISEHDLTAREFCDLCRADEKWGRLMRRGGVRMVELRGADHTFSSRESLQRATQECLAWLDANCRAKAAA